MVFEQFKDKVCEALQEVLGDSYQITYQEVMKNNGVELKGIIIEKKGDKISPTIYLESLYEDYEDGNTFGDIIYEILRVYRKSKKEIKINMDFFRYYEQVRERILYKLVHRQSNQKLLQEVPFISWNDLAIVFYYAMDDKMTEKASILIRNSHLEMWDVSLDRIYQDAKENMPKILPEEMMPIKKLLKELLGKELPIFEKESSNMYVLTNKDRLFGAASLLYAKGIKELSDRLQKNLIILPSSVHEVILLPDEGTSAKEFYRNMVKEVNDTQVDEEERLSYSVYYYNRLTEEIEIF